MKERTFIEELQKRAKEQEQLLNALPYPRLFVYIAKWFSDHPMRIIIPLAIIISITLRLMVGPAYTHLILLLFSKL